ncbi:non-hydrolyzing UDP-N-acetylglucosamine 2-epimerase [Kitasatospora herbaricolor]|uniref:UDP-N-acetylglucosamine 2-epimerase (Non-hydrolyzing) n=1 Tax=Kitasatospora herbaricolor TaxID=68217 RepID=A0ABZ1WE44_9ACTN|nr:UDP-N-acetylglucosamine 2-epimerase (non-hydrolyzing) [Kitasatospora herbaricolor]
MIRGGSVAVVLGTRPEIVKLARVVRGLGEHGRLVYTGQHYDDTLSGSIFRGMNLPAPRLRLDGIGGMPRGRQIGAMISALCDAFTLDPPRAVVVQGDTNSTSAGAQAAQYCDIPVIHVEAGLRSRDRAMPEEINRQVVGVLAELHCAPTEVAAANLRAEGVPPSRIRVTGNTIVEAVTDSLPGHEESRAMLRRYGVPDDGFVLVTLHRPENTDDPHRLRLILDELERLGLPVLFPVHPRTLHRAEGFGLRRALAGLGAVDPVDHRAFLGLARHARLLVSDSGGVQEECTVLKKPLIVLRNSTERPEAVEAGFATLLRPGPDIGRVAREYIADATLAARLASRPSPYGDGRASERIVELALALAGRPARTPTPHTSPAHHGPSAAPPVAAAAHAVPPVASPVPSL